LEYYSDNEYNERVKAEYFDSKEKLADSNDYSVYDVYDDLFK